MYKREDMFIGHDGVLHPREQAKRISEMFEVDAEKFITELKDNKMIYLDDTRLMYWDIVLDILNEEQ